MEKNYHKINSHIKKYNRIYLYYFFAYIVLVSLELVLDAPILLLIPLLLLLIIHILTRCVDAAKMDVLTNEELFDKNLKKLNKMEKNKDWSEEADKVFVSGKITGDPIDECVYKFSDACEDIFNLEKEDQIIRIVNPLFIKGIHFGISHEEAMGICLKELRDCSHIYMLRDWKESKGAKIEHQFALDNGIRIIYQ